MRMCIGAIPAPLDAYLLIDRVRSFPLLIVLTHRPEIQSRWVGTGMCRA